MKPSDSPEFLGYTHSSLQSRKTCKSSVLDADSIFFRLHFLSSDLNLNNPLPLPLYPFSSLSPPPSFSPFFLSFSPAPQVHQHPS